MNAITIPGDSLFGIPDVSVAGFTGLFEWVESHIDSHIKVTYRDSRITLEKDDLSVTSYRHPRTGLIFIDSVPSASAPALIHACVKRGTDQRRLAEFSHGERPAEDGVVGRCSVPPPGL